VTDRCKATTQAGKQYARYATHGEYCPIHATEMQGQWEKWRKEGGKQTQKKLRQGSTYNLPGPPPETAEEVGMSCGTFGPSLVSRTSKCGSTQQLGRSARTHIRLRAPVFKFDLRRGLRGTERHKKAQNQVKRPFNEGSFSYVCTSVLTSSATITPQLRGHLAFTSPDPTPNYPSHSLLMMIPAR
jgi:hypothetical protein